MKYDDEEDEERKKLKTIRIQKMPIFANSVANTSFMNKKKSKHIFDQDKKLSELCQSKIINQLN